MSEKFQPAGPFAPARPSSARVSLWMLLFSMIVFAGISLALMLATRVPIIANGINDLFGLPQAAKSDKTDRTTHLIFLLFCYSSPLLFATWISILQGVISYWNRRRNEEMVEEESSNPFA